METPEPITERPDFSLVLGGPLFQMYRRARLSGDALELQRRRVLVITFFAWLPLLILSVIDGHAVGHGIRIPFFRDVEAHVRFLVALPALLIAELEVHTHITPFIRQFVERGIVNPQDRPAYDAAIRSALRARNSVVIELVLVALVYTVGCWIWRGHAAMHGATWYATPTATHLNLTPAGYWYAFISIPIFQFILLRWYMRLLVWFRFLWQVSRLNLHLKAAHPDRAGGIGFLGAIAYAFGPILFAQGALVSGMIASRVLYDGQSLLSFRVEALGYVVLFVFSILGPLCVFTPQLALTKRVGLAEYGLLASQYVYGFESKWILPTAPEMSEFLGTGDIQSLADLGNSYGFVRQMRLVPFGLNDVGLLAAMAAAPLLPLTLTIWSVEELLVHIAKVIF
jgi:hypothetical protein